MPGPQENSTRQAARTLRKKESEQRRKQRKTADRTRMTQEVSKTKEGPDYVCTSCRRLVYGQTVVTLNVPSTPKQVILSYVFGTENLYFKL